MYKRACDLNVRLPHSLLLLLYITARNFLYIPLHFKFLSSMAATNVSLFISLYIIILIHNYHYWCIIIPLKPRKKQEKQKET